MVLTIEQVKKAIDYSSAAQRITEFCSNSDNLLTLARYIVDNADAGIRHDEINAIIGIQGSGDEPLEIIVDIIAMYPDVFKLFGIDHIKNYYVGFQDQAVVFLPSRVSGIKTLRATPAEFELAKKNMEGY